LLFDPNLPDKLVLAVDLEACHLDCCWPLLDFPSDFFLFELLELLFKELLLFEDLLLAAFSEHLVLALQAFSVCYSQYWTSIF
jgi:hypothetical protein